MIRFIDRLFNSYPKRLIILGCFALTALAFSCFYNISLSLALIRLENPLDLFTLASLPAAYQTFLGRFLVQVLASTMLIQDYIFSFFKAFSLSQIFYLSVIVGLIFTKRKTLENKILLILLFIFTLLVLSYVGSGVLGVLAYNAKTTLQAIIILGQIGWLLCIVNFSLLLVCLVSIFLLLYNDYFNSFIYPKNYLLNKNKRASRP